MSWTERFPRDSVSALWQRLGERWVILMWYHVKDAEGCSVFMSPRHFIPIRNPFSPLTKSILMGLARHCLLQGLRSWSVARLHKLLPGLLPVRWVHCLGMAADLCWRHVMSFAIPKTLPPAGSAVVQIHPVTWPDWIWLRTETDSSQEMVYAVAILLLLTLLGNWIGYWTHVDSSIRLTTCLPFTAPQCGSPVGGHDHRAIGGVRPAADLERQFGGLRIWSGPWRDWCREEMVIGVNALSQHASSFEAASLSSSINFQLT